jgi:hypothetical protein
MANLCKLCDVLFRMSETVDMNENWVDLRVMANRVRVECSK